MPQNLWIDASDGFRSRCLELFEAFDRVGRQILKATAEVLELDDNFFDDKVDADNSILPVIHYPPMARQ